MVKPDGPLAVVQFLHPGAETLPTFRSGWCPWSNADIPHRRKFMEARGSYSSSIDGPSDEGLIGFWGEWEAASQARRVGRPNDDLPEYCHKLQYADPPDIKGLHDTDPFVFGDRFLYNGCQQHTNHDRPGGATDTFLRWMPVGSMILFGASISGRFVLDTVLVASDFIDYERGDIERVAPYVPPEYIHIAIRTQAAVNPTVDSFRLYRGATFDQRLAGMFSFTPAVPLGNGRGFARPHIRLPGILTQELSQSKKRTKMTSIAAVADVWREVTRQVLASGCVLAHKLDWRT